MAAARGRRGGSVSEDNCVKCKKKTSGCWFQCDASDSWTHAECMSMAADEYQTLKKFPNFKYYCLLFPEDNSQCHIAMRRNKEQFVVPWKESRKSSSICREKKERK